MICKQKYIQLGYLAEINRGICLSGAKANINSSINLKILESKHIAKYGLSSTLSDACIQIDVKKDDFLKNNDLIVKRLNPDFVGIFKNEEEATLISSNLLRVRCNEHICVKYLAYLFECTPILKNLLKISGMSTSVNTLGLKELKELEIPILLMNEQMAIGEIWQKTKRQNQLLEDLQLANNKILKSIYSRIK